MGILTLSILTEWVMDLIQEHVSQAMGPMVRSAFQELTVLGFISLFVFLSMLSGILPKISSSIFGMDDELKEVLEQIHFMMFLFIMLFIATVAVQMVVLSLMQRRRQKLEVLVSDKMDEVEANYIKWYKAKVKPFNLMSIFKRDDAVFAMEYMITRLRFLQELEAKETMVDGFDFASYLADCHVTALADVINIHPTTWAFLLVFLIPMPFFMKIHSAPIKLGLILTLGFLLWLAAALLLRSFRQIRYRLHGVPKLGTSETERELSEALTFHVPEQPLRVALLKLPPPYLRGSDSVSHDGGVLWSLIYGRAPNRHENLFVGGSRGKRIYFGMLRQLVFMNSVYLAVVVIRFWAVAAAYAWWLPLPFVIFPALNIGYYFMQMLDELSVITSIGMMPNKTALKMVLLEVKVTKLTHAMRLLTTMNLIHSVNKDDLVPITDDLKTKFGQISGSNSGSVTGAALKKAAEGWGRQYTYLTTNAIDDNWKLSLAEFAALVASALEADTGSRTHGAPKKEKIEDLVEKTWEHLDKDGSGAITAQEFAAYIRQAMGKSGSAEASKQDELSAMVILKEADLDHDGNIDREELTQLLTKYVHH